MGKAPAPPEASLFNRALAAPTIKAAELADPRLKVSNYYKQNNFSNKLKPYQKTAQNLNINDLWPYGSLCFCSQVALLQYLPLIRIVLLTLCF